jgi:hypothetical protein
VIPSQSILSSMRNARYRGRLRVDKCSQPTAPVRQTRRKLNTWMFNRVPDVVRRYFELDPRQAESFVALFSGDAIVLRRANLIAGPMRPDRCACHRPDRTIPRVRAYTVTGTKGWTRKPRQLVEAPTAASDYVADKGDDDG